MMTHYRLAGAAAAILAAIAAPAGAAQSSAPDPAVMATVRAALDAAKAGDMRVMSAQYAPDCTFIDEFAPFLWTGPDALGGYLASGGRMYQETQHNDGTMSISPPSYAYESGDRAFVVEPVSGTATVRGKPYAVHGAFAFTLARVGGRWKITSQTWTKTSESMDPY